MRVLQTLALPLGHVTIFGVMITTPFGAADEARTRYLHLGKVALYQMSYGRISGAFIPAPSRSYFKRGPHKICEARFCGEKEKIWYSSQKSCLQDFPMNDRIFDVVPPIGIEPMTRGFSVPCSTD